MQADAVADTLLRSAADRSQRMQTARTAGVRLAAAHLERVLGHVKPASLPQIARSLRRLHTLVPALQQAALRMPGQQLVCRPAADALGQPLLGPRLQTAF